MRLINHQKDFFLSHPSIKKNKMIKSYYLKLLVIIVLVNQVQNLEICEHALTRECITTQVQEERWKDETMTEIEVYFRNVITPYCV
jgi:hypothetical protein